MALSTGNFAELLWPGIKDLFGTSYKDWKPLYTQVFTVQTSDKNFEKFQGVTGTPLVGVKTQGNTVPYADPYQGFQKEFVHTTYALGVTVTREMVEDDQYSYIRQLPGFLSRSMKQSMETDHFNVINNATTATITGADGVTLANASHPLVGGGTFSNQPATAADLSQTALETAFTDIMNFVDDQSLKINVMPKTLLVSTSDWANAEKILQTKYAVGSADNDINPIEGRLNLVVSPYLTDTDAWTVITDVPNGLISMKRRAPTIDRENAFDTQNLKIITTARWSRSWVDPRCVYHSVGA